MKITKDNYFSEIEKIGVDELPEELLQAHELISDKTELGKNWNIYDADPEMKDVIDLSFEKLGELIDYRQSPSCNEEELGATHKQRGTASDPDIKTPLDAAKAMIRPYVLRGDTISQIEKSYMGVNNGVFTASVRRGKILVDAFRGKKVFEAFRLMDVFRDVLAEKKGKPGKRKEKPAPVAQEKASAKHLKEIVAKETERISEEVRFIKRFKALHNKTKEKKQILAFINSLQKAMLERRIRKSSKLAKEILYIQESLLKIYNSMISNKIKVELKQRRQRSVL